MILPPNSFIVAGPVIIENGKVLLDKEQKDDKITKWFFPGGGMKESDLNFEETCKREVKEEMGIDIKIIRPIKPMMIKEDGRIGILIHYLAERIGEIKPGNDIVEWGWYDINNLPDDCAENVYEVIKDL